MFEMFEFASPNLSICFNFCGAEDRCDVNVFKLTPHSQSIFIEKSMNELIWIVK